MILPAQFANEVREGEKILFCPYCSRILFYQESEEGDNTNYFAMNDTGSLNDLDDSFDEDEDDEDEDDIASDDAENSEESSEDEISDGEDENDDEEENDEDSSN